MTNSEAQQVADALRAGQMFITRFQEESWGLAYRADNKTFEKWEERVEFFTNAYGQTDGRTVQRTQTLTEAQLFALLESSYSFEAIWRKLR